MSNPDFALIASETGSSQQVFSLHNSCRILLPSKRMGATNPSVPKIEVIVDRIPLFVHGLSLSII